MKYFPILAALFLVLALLTRPHGIVGQIGILLAGIGIFTYAIVKAAELFKEWGS